MRKGANFVDSRLFCILPFKTIKLLLYSYAHREYFQYNSKLGQISILYQSIRKTSKELNPLPLGCGDLRRWLSFYLSLITRKTWENFHHHSQASEATRTGS